MIFVAMVLKLGYRNRHTPLTFTDGEFAHAAITNAISAADPEAGRVLHDMRRHKRMTLSIVDSDAHTAKLRLTFMAQEGLTYASILASALSACSRLRLGPTVCDVTAADVTDPYWADISTWADLMAEATHRHFHFTFVTPTAITKRDGSGRRFVSPFPVPLDVFSGLARRWQALEGPPLPGDLNDYVYSGGCVAANYRTRADTFTLRKRKQVGLTGWVLYECRRDSAPYVAALNALTRFASFTGVGYQTMRGMGAVRVRISD